MKKKIVIISISVILTLLVLFLCNLQVRIDLSTINDTMEYNSEFSTPKAFLCGRVLLGDLKEIEVKENKIESIKTGKIIKTYSAGFAFYNATEEKEILIVDTQKPIIELVQNDEKYTLPNSEYQEEGFSAFDDYDGDITDKVKRTVVNDKVIYSVKDSSGNATVVERTIKYKDPVPPEIVLNGEKTIEIKQGDTYIERGAKAVDNCDGDITKSIIIDGFVDTNTIGTYEIKYSISDNSGNVSEAIRTIVVRENVALQKNGKTIYLTFDDGPSIYTERLLSILKKYNVKATFFVVGNKGKNDIITKIADDGHAIGIHSVSHSYSSIYKSEEAFLNDLYSMQSIIKEKTGIETFLMRFPGGSSNSVSKQYCKGIMSKLTKKVEELGFEYFDWNVSSGDGGGVKTSEEVINNVKSGVTKHKNSVVLQHDTQEFSVDAVEEIIIWGLENGYTFEKLDMNSPKAHHGVNN